MKSLILLLISIFLITSCNKKNTTTTQKESKTSVITKTFKLDDKTVLFKLPKDTQSIVNLKSVKSIFDNFLFKENSAFGVEFRESDLSEIKKVLAINPLNLKDLESIGIDINKELGLAFSNIIWGKRSNLSSINIIAYIPLKDNKKFMSFIESKFENGKFKGDDNGELNLKKENGYLKFFGKHDDEVLYAFVKDNYLFAVINPVNPQASLTLTTNLIKGDNLLKDSKTFQETAKLSKTNSGIYLYGDLENLINTNKVRIEEEFSRNMKNTQIFIDMLKTYKSMSVLLALDSKDFLLDFSVVLDQNSQALNLFKGLEYNNSTILGLDKPAAILMSFGINISEYMNLIKSFLGKNENQMIEDQMAKGSAEYGFDIKKDLINNFDGNFSFATYDGMSISTTNYNSIISIGFKNIKAIQNVFNKLLENPKLKEMAKFVTKAKEGGQDIYVINAMVTQIYVAFKKNELVITSNKDMYKSAMSSNNKSGFYKYAQKDTHLKDSTNSQMIFYVSFLEIIKAINNFKGMLPPEPTKIAIDSLELLDYFLVTTNINKANAVGSYVLKTNSDKLFFPSVIETIKKYKK